MPDLTAAAQDILEAVDDDMIAEAEHLCANFGIPAEYARNLAAAIWACLPDGA